MNFDEKTAQELAKCIVLRCFRNTELENLHAGIIPHSETGDYSDVYVVTPAGKIAWSEVSRISNDEIKILMQEVVNKTYSFLMNMGDDDFLEKSLKYSQRRTHSWDKPKFVENLAQWKNC
jgi:hypothetical protein